MLELIRKPRNTSMAESSKGRYVIVYIVMHKYMDLVRINPVFIFISVTSPS